MFLKLFWLFKSSVSFSLKEMKNIIKQNNPAKICIEKLIEFKLRSKKWIIIIKETDLKNTWYLNTDIIAKEWSNNL